MYGIKSPPGNISVPTDDVDFMTDNTGTYKFKKSPNIVLGTASARHTKNHISAEHSNHEPNLTSRDANAYANPSSLGKQIQSRFESSSELVFGKAKRMNYPDYMGANFVSYKFGNYGPSDIIPASLGKDAPKPSFGYTNGGNAHRLLWTEEFSKEINKPGPGQYSKEGRSALGVQPTSTNQTSPSYSFGASNREVILHFAGIPSTDVGQSSPGPQAYNQDSGIGKTTAVHIADAEYRYQKNEADLSPGPGQYYQNPDPLDNCKPMRIGTGTRLNLSEMKNNYKPGPGAYDVKQSIGSKYSDSIKHKKSSTFGTSPRFGGTPR